MHIKCLTEGIYKKAKTKQARSKKAGVSTFPISQDKAYKRASMQRADQTY